MPPKSKKAPNWFKCDKCLASVAYKDSKNHPGECPSALNSWLTPFVSSSILNTTLDTKDLNEDNTVPPEMANNLIFVNPYAMELCNFVIGDPVLIESNANDIPSIVRLVWPISSTIPTFASIPEIYLNPDWQNNICLKVSIKSLTATLLCADTIHVENLMDNEMFSNPDFTKYAQSHLIGTIVSVRNKINVPFFGTPVTLNIIKMIANSIEYDKNIKDEQWFAINEHTKWKFCNNDTKPEKAKKQLCVGGVDSILSDIQTIANIALNNDSFNSNINLIKCVLLYGSSGTGKSLICKYIASQIQVNTVNICGSQIYSKFFGETEAALKKAFDEAINNSPSIILIDEIDTLCPKQSSTSTEQEKRIISAMATILDNIHIGQNNIFILANTSRPDMIDLTLRRYGRIDHEIEIPIPDKIARFDIMKKLFENFPHALTQDEINQLAESAHGFVGADIGNLFTQATMHMMRNNALTNDLKAQFADFQWALQQVKPSAMREVLLDIPNVKWCDIGGQDDLKLKLKQAVEWPLRHSKSFLRLGIKPPSGVLMYGPPGCSKTMIAKALASESGLNFLSIKGPELFSKWVGESERAVRDLFRKARQVAPSIIFFDEIDAISGERYKNSGSANVQERVLAQILTELDGISPLGNVTVVAATNRPDKIDSALLRPGRLDRIVYVPLPDRETRSSIFTIKLAKMSLAKDVSVEYLVENTENYSGAEVQAVCHEAALKALEEDIDCVEVLLKHFDTALQIVKPRTPPNLLSIYEKFGESFL
ncbi:ATPase family gene 2 protein homolog A [Arctopsyche grandis]|uniref:ATPase family gene 2 protein homolog A n=1 Tax=Arctopsyche grandis TaxID=121162 RepID=UPI00406D677F